MKVVGPQSSHGWWGRALLGGLVVVPVVGAIIVVLLGIEGLQRFAARVPADPASFVADRPAGPTAACVVENAVRDFLSAVLANQEDDPATDLQVGFERHRGSGTGGRRPTDEPELWCW